MKTTFLAALLLSAAPALAQRQNFPPVDEADRDPALVEFRADLLSKVRARDTEAVVAAACPDIYLSHGTEGGPEELRSNLTQQPETQSADATGNADAYWQALQDTLSQPGYFDDQGEFWMPHAWKITLPAALDPFTAYFVSGENVSLRTGPSRSDPILDLISHEVVIVPEHRSGAEYQKVLLTDGTPGYMHGDFLWSMVGYRAALVKTETGDWQICTFVTGD